jgi:hypothetical protein
MDQGKVAEFDTPKVLVENEKSLFSQLIAKTDEKTAAHLKSIALGQRKAEF